MTALLVTGPTVSQPRDPALLAAALAAFEDNRRGDRLAEASRLKGEFLLGRPPSSLRRLYTPSRFPATPGSWITPAEGTGRRLRGGYGHNSFRPSYKALAVNYAIAQGLVTRLGHPGPMTAEGCQATIARVRPDDGEASHRSRRSPICARHHPGGGKAERHGAAARRLEDLGPNTDIPVPLPGRQCSLVLLECGRCRWHGHCSSSRRASGLVGCRPPDTGASRRIRWGMWFL
jgi:hypothetical protein